MTVKQHFKGSKSGSHLNRSRHVTQKSPRRNNRLTHRKFSKNFYFVEKQINKKPITVCVCVCECTYVGLVSSWLEKSYKSLFIFFRVWTSSSSSAILTFVFSQSPNTDWKHKQKQAITHHRKKKKNNLCHLSPNIVLCSTSSPKSLFSRPFKYNTWLVLHQMILPLGVCPYYDHQQYQQ